VISLGALRLTPYTTFNLVLRSTKLWVSPYSEYQEDLWKVIIGLRNQGLSYNKIAHYLNENEYKTPRNKTFRGPHVHSIVKKKAIRDERLNREHPLEIENFSIIYL
jgi:DNA-binding transcriptional MerR regulator